MVSRDLYPATRTSSRFYSATSAPGGEIDLRKEFDALLFGTEGDIKHSHLIVIRHLRRDSSGKPIECTCRDPFTKEPDPDCSYCFGESFLSDEKWYECYSMYVGSSGGFSNKSVWMPPGEVRGDLRVFFFRFDVPIKYRDKIVEMKLDAEGKAIVPYIREAIYKPQTIYKYRSDNGRIEYIAVYCREEDAIRPDNIE